MDDYGRAIQQDPAPLRYVQRGVGLFALGRMEAAIQDFDRAIKLYDQQINYVMGIPGNLDEAAKLNPKLALAYNNRGSAYYQIGQTEKAINDYDRAIGLGPRSAEFYANREVEDEMMRKEGEEKRDGERAIRRGFDPALLGQD